MSSKEQIRKHVVHVLYTYISSVKKRNTKVYSNFSVPLRFELKTSLVIAEL